MLYDLRNEEKRRALKGDTDRLIAKATDLVELTTKKPTRTRQQNRYFWALMGFLGGETGCTKEEMATIVKRQICSSIFKTTVHPMRLMPGKGGTVCRKARHTVVAYRSFGELDTADMGRVIDKVRDFFARELGITTPSPDDWRAAYEMAEAAERAGVTDL